MRNRLIWMLIYVSWSESDGDFSLNWITGTSLLSARKHWFSLTLSTSIRLVCFHTAEKLLFLKIYGFI